MTLSEACEIRGERKESTVAKMSDCNTALTKSQDSWNKDCPLGESCISSNDLTLVSPLCQELGAAQEKRSLSIMTDLDPTVNSYAGSVLKEDLNLIQRLS